MKELIIKLALTDKEALGSVRTHKQLLAAEDREWIWLRGIEVKSIDTSIRQLPARKSYEMDEAENLFPLGGFTPVGKLKSLQWMSVGEFIEVEMPTSAMPAQIGQKYHIQIVPSTKVKVGEALMTTLSLWKEYAYGAPEARLKRLQFAVSEAYQVLIMGTPLPAIPGKEYWIQEDMLLPAGFDFKLPWISGLVASRLNPLKDGFILFSEDGSWDKIVKEALVPATRSAVRLTEEKRQYE